MLNFVKYWNISFLGAMLDIINAVLVLDKQHANEEVA